MDLTEAKARGYQVAVRHPWESARVSVVGQLIRRHVSLGAERPVIDIGCGDTFVVEQLAAAHGQTSFYAIDTAFTGDLLEQFRRRLNNPRIKPFPSLDAIAPPPDRAASLILLMDVIEHIEHDRQFLTDLRTRPFVDRDTRFLVTVPAYQSLFCSHDAFLGHYRRYSNTTLRVCLEESGYRILDIGYFFTSLLPLRIMQVVRERLLGVKPGEQTGLVTWQGGAALTSLMRRALEADGRASMFLSTLGVRLPGLSNYAVCAKSA